MPIIRRNNCLFATLGTCYSLWMAVWYAGWNEMPPCIENSHPTNTKRRKITVVSSDDVPIVVQNMFRLINILRINYAPSWFYLQKKKLIVSYLYI